MSSPLNDNHDANEVKLHFLDYWRVIKLRSGLILLTFFLVIVTVGLYVFFLPREFYSRVTMEVKPDNQRSIELLGPSARSYDPGFIPTQFAIMKKPEILYPVIKRLDLTKRFSPPGLELPEQAILVMLEDAMVVQEQRNTSLIEIGIYNKERELAAAIANTIAIVYQERRLDDLQKNFERAVAQIQDELRNQRDIVSDLFLQAAKVRQEDGIVDPDPESLNSLITMGDASVRLSEQLFGEQSAKVQQLKSQLTRVQQLKPEELMEAMRILGIEDQTVLQILPALLAARGEEARLLESGLADNHPRLKSLRAQMSIYNGILKDQLDSISRSLATRLSIEENTQAVFVARLDDAKKKHIEERTRMNKYVELKSKYIMAKQLMQISEQRLNAARIENQISFLPAKIWEKAEAAVKPSRPKVAMSMVLAALVGLIIGIGLAFFIEYLDTSVKTIDDIERFLALPVLAVVPKDITILIQQKGETPDAEAYRILKANIEFNKTDREANTFTLVSGGPGEGKSTTLNNLAYTFAKGGYKVLVVDADLRRPSQHRLFEVDNSFGLADYLQGRAQIDEITKSTKVENLAFIPSGILQNEDVGILNSGRMAEFIKKVKRQYEVVFVDSTPILGVSDASVLVSEMDNTIMVVQHRRFPRSMLQRVKQAVLHVGGKLIGVVLNNVDTKHDDSYSYYSNYNDYYSPKPGEEDHLPAPVAAGAKSGHNDQY